MRARSVLAVLLMLSSTGCGKDESPPPPAASESGAAVAGGTAPVVPFTGIVTAAQLERAVEQVVPHQPWGAAWSALRATVGEPTRVDGDLHGWYVLEGDECHFLEVTRDAQRGEVGSSSHGAAGADTPSYFAKCKPPGPEAAVGGEKTGEETGPASGSPDGERVEPSGW